MREVINLAGALLVAGPLLGAVPVAHPALMTIWSAPRERHLAIVAAHRLAWVLLNIGFGVGTIATTAGLVILAGALGDDAMRGAGLATAAVIYAVGGALWCAVLAIRARTTPLLGDLLAAGTATEPAEAMMGALNGGLFAGYVLSTTIALVVLGLTLLAAGGVTVVAAIGSVGIGALGAAWLAATGDLIPAVLYLPTLFIGVALLAGWS